MDKARKQTLLIVDYGSQYNLLIARRIRELNVFSEIVPPTTRARDLKGKDIRGVIFSGGPASIYEAHAPKLREDFLKLNVPILGICYGMQALSEYLGGSVQASARREYGRAELRVVKGSPLFKGIPRLSQVWMSHADKVTRLPKGFVQTAVTSNTAFAACEDVSRRIWGVQFHPEVMHTVRGKDILKNFVYGICRFQGSWSLKSFVKESTALAKDTIGKDNVILGLSGGVDSSVVAALLSKAVGRKLHCIFVNNGLLRKGEEQQVRRVFTKEFKVNLKVVDARKRFIRALKGVEDPEKKRKIIGREFVNVFQREAKKIKKARFLAQGTLYPDVVESHSAFGGPSKTIKTHHNVGGLPTKMKLGLIEPLKELFKDEVRIVGKSLGLSPDVIDRHPFPGPGLGVRILGEVTEKRLQVLREADHLFIRELHSSGLYSQVWQALSVLLPVKSVGVMGDCRTYENVLALRTVTSLDGMTADWGRLPDDFLARVSNMIINEVRGVNRVVYDISSKPPATIEWE